jgi:hypothetical protein
MLDINGKPIRVGDDLRVGNWTVGLVVCSMDTGEFSPAYPKGVWEHLERGIMVETHHAGLIHYAENIDELEIIEPKSI